MKALVLIAWLAVACGGSERAAPPATHVEPPPPTGDEGTQADAPEPTPEVVTPPAEPRRRAGLEGVLDQLDEIHARSIDMRGALVVVQTPESTIVCAMRPEPVCFEGPIASMGTIWIEPGTNALECVGFGANGLRVEGGAVLEGGAPCPREHMQYLHSEGAAPRTASCSTCAGRPAARPTYAAAFVSLASAHSMGTDLGPVSRLVDADGRVLYVLGTESGLRAGEAAVDCIPRSALAAAPDWIAVRCSVEVPGMSEQHGYDYLELVHVESDSLETRATLQVGGFMRARGERGGMVEQQWSYQAALHRDGCVTLRAEGPRARLERARGLELRPAMGWTHDLDRSGSWRVVEAGFERVPSCD